MKQIIVACRTLQDEIETIMRQEQLDIPIVWFPSGLHNVPSELGSRVQQELDKLPPVDQVILGMAYCGNSVQGLQSRDFQLVLPRMDDCISLLLGRVKTWDPQCSGVYFMTAGWLRGERNLLTEYNYCLEKYGRQRGAKIFETMFRHYSDVALLDTGCYEKAAVEAEMRHTAQVLSLNYREVPGDLSLLRQLLKGPWPEEHFLILPPQSQITADMLTLK